MQGKVNARIENELLFDERTDDWNFLACSCQQIERIFDKWCTNGWMRCVSTDENRYIGKFHQQYQLVPEKYYTILRSII